MQVSLLCIIFCYLFVFVTFFYHHVLYITVISVCLKVNSMNILKLLLLPSVYMLSQKCLMVDRFKLLKWWAQSFLIGISKIVCGFRDDAGVVRHIEEFHTSDLPKQSRVLY